MMASDNQSIKSRSEVARERLEIDIDGLKISLASIRRNVGSPPILFLHGFGGTKEDYTDIQFQRRFKDRSFIAYDSPGHGDSTCSDLSLVTVDLLVRLAEEVISRLLPPTAPFFLLGHSMGGLVSLLLAAKLSTRVLGFIDIKGNLAPEDCFLSRQIYLYPDDELDRFVQGFLKRAMESKHYGDSVWATNLRAKVDIQVLRSTFASMVQSTDSQDLLAMFIGLTCPKMFMYGEQFSTLSYLETLRQGGVQLAEIPQAAHFVMYSNPVSMWDKIYTFLDEISYAMTRSDPQPEVDLEEQAIPRGQLERLSALDTNTVSDALDFLGLKGATFGIQPLWDCPKITGRACTIQLASKADSSPTAHLITPVVDAIETSDRVLVVSGGVEGISCWGDILANAAKAKGVRGTILDGCSRDIDGSRDIDYPVYGKGVTMISARDRLVQVASGQPVQMAGVTVSEGDYVIADHCGTVFIPRENIDAVLTQAERIHHRQEGMLEAVRSGAPVEQVMHDAKFEAAYDDDQPRALWSGQRRGKPPCEEDREIVAMFANCDTPGVSDALDKLGLHGQAMNIAPLANYTKVTVGPAYTVRYVPASDPAGSVGDFIDDVAQGDIVVIDNGGRTDCTVWGDIMTQYAGIRGIEATVIDGVCRDVNRALTDGYPLFTAGRFMRTGKDRVQVGSVNEPISVGTVRVASRDIVVADANGVVVVPRHRAREVAEVAGTIELAESKIRKLIAGRITLTEARKRLDYHNLQRKSLASL
jgi:regulator of RNase E activity RraA/pimeloyl-ACP methyl ester carboxylesterase